jgi:hypothetical protein
MIGEREKVKTMTGKPKDSLDPQAPRELYVKFRMNEFEKIIVEEYLDKANFRPNVIARKFAERMQKHEGDFESLGALLRCLFGLPKISPGAPLGNNNNPLGRYGREENDQE